MPKHAAPPGPLTVTGHAAALLSALVAVLLCAPLALLLNAAPAAAASTAAATHCPIAPAPELADPRTVAPALWRTTRT